MPMRSAAEVLRVRSVAESSPRVGPVRRARGAHAASADVATPLESGMLEGGAEVVLTVEVARAAR